MAVQLQMKTRTGRLCYTSALVQIDVALVQVCLSISQLHAMELIVDWFFRGKNESFSFEKAAGPMQQQGDSQLANQLHK